jgi:DnaJ-class molecular chaperone
MLKTLKTLLAKQARGAIWAYREGRYEMDAKTRRAFDRLGLSYESDLDTVKQRYRHLSKQYHPDGGIQKDSEAFIALKQSYDTLLSAFKTKGR